jgi:hypothetical protein
MWIAAVVSFAVLATITGAAVQLLSHWWRATPSLAGAHGLLGLGLALHAMWMAYWVTPGLGIAVAWGLLVGAIVVLVRARAWRSWRGWAGPVALTAGAGAASLGLTFLWGGAQASFATVGLRFVCGPPPADGGCGPLPPDNLLPQLFADRLWLGEGTAAILGDWNGSDRPPLQSGAILLLRPIAGAFGVPHDAAALDPLNAQWAFAASVVCQLTLIVAVLTLVEALGFHRRVAALAATFATVIPLSVVNVPYTWPKILSGALAVAGVAVLARAIRTRPPRLVVPLTVAASLATLSLLAHGTGAFALPLFACLGMVVLRRHGVRFAETAAACLAVVAVVSAVYAPWQLYATYADPSTNRLPKWHLAGVIAPDDRSLLAALEDSYTSTPLDTLIDARIANLEMAFGPGLEARFSSASDWPMQIRSQDFFTSVYAIGLGTVLCIGLAFVLLICALRRRPVSARLRLSALLLGLSLLSMLLWICVLFLPGGAVVHVSSHTWLLLFAVIPLACLAARWFWAGVAVTVAQAGYSGAAYWSPAAGPSNLDPGWAAVYAGGVLVMAAVVWLTPSTDGDSPSPRHEGDLEPQGVEAVV